MSMWLVFYWTGPIGVGIFLLCLGGMIYLLTKADIERKRFKKEERTKQQAEKK